MTELALPAAQLVIYLLLALPLVYVLVRHGKHGILGWIYLTIFCLLRITGSGLQIRDSAGTGALVISSIGLSPLLLATSGLLHEARTYRSPNRSPCIEWSLVIGMHLLISGGLALVASGASALIDSNEASTTGSLVLLRVGMFTLLASWVLILIEALASLLLSRRGHGTAVWYREGSKILYTVLLSLPFTCIRVVYGCVSTILQSQVLNSLALRVCLSVVPEMIVVIAFVFIGLDTREIGRSRNEDERGGSNLRMENAKTDTA